MKFIKGVYLFFSLMLISGLAAPQEGEQVIIISCGRYIPDPLPATVKSPSQTNEFKALLLHKQHLFVLDQQYLYQLNQKNLSISQRYKLSEEGEDWIFDLKHINGFLVVYGFSYQLQSHKLMKFNEVNSRFNLIESITFTKQVMESPEYKETVMQPPLAINDKVVLSIDPKEQEFITVEKKSLKNNKIQSTSTSIDIVNSVSLLVFVDVNKGDFSYRVVKSNNDVSLDFTSNVNRLVKVKDTKLVGFVEIDREGYSLDNEHSSIIEYVTQGEVRSYNEKEGQVYLLEFDLVSESYQYQLLEHITKEQVYDFDLVENADPYIGFIYKDETLSSKITPVSLSQQAIVGEKQPVFTLLSEYPSAISINGLVYIYTPRIDLARKELVKYEVKIWDTYASDLETVTLGHSPDTLFANQYHTFISGMTKDEHFMLSVLSANGSLIDNVVTPGLYDSYKAQSFTFSADDVTYIAQALYTQQGVVKEVDFFEAVNHLEQVLALFSFKDGKLEYLGEIDYSVSKSSHCRHYCEETLDNRYLVANGHDLYLLKGKEVTKISISNDQTLKLLTQELH